MLSFLVIATVAIALGSADAQTTPGCVFGGKTYKEGEIATRTSGFCTCIDGKFQECGCYNWDGSTVMAGDLVYKVAQVCRCTGPQAEPPLMDTLSECVPLRPSVLSTPFRSILTGTDYGYNFDKEVVTVLNKGNFIPSVDYDIQFVHNVIKPCTSTPHWHPRASEWYVVPESEIYTVFAEEKEPKIYEQSIVGPGLSVMAKGLMHTLINPTCENVNIFVLYDSADPGRVDVPGVDCTNPPEAVDGPSLLVLEHCKRVAACEAKCGL